MGNISVSVVGIPLSHYSFNILSKKNTELKIDSDPKLLVCISVLVTGCTQKRLNNVSSKKGSKFE